MFIIICASFPLVAELMLFSHKHLIPSTNWVIACKLFLKIRKNKENGHCVILCVFSFSFAGTESQMTTIPFRLWCGSFQPTLPYNAQRLSAGCVLLRSTAVGAVMIPFSCFPCGRSEWKNQRRLPLQPCLPGNFAKAQLRPLPWLNAAPSPRKSAGNASKPLANLWRAAWAFCVLSRWSVSVIPTLWDPNEGGPANGSLAAPS